MKCNAKRIWFHGDTSRRSTFADQRFQSGNDGTTGIGNAMGPGIYFTSLLEQAVGYAGRKGWVYTATIRGKCAVDHQRATVKEIRRFVSMLDAEGRGYLFSNWSENPRNAMALIEESYSQLDLVSAMADLGRQGGLDYEREGREWAAAMVALGYTALLHKLPAAEHLVVWDPAAIRVVQEVPAHEVT